MQPIKFSYRSKEFACLSNLYEAEFTIDGIQYRHVEGYLQSVMFAKHNPKAATHLRVIQSPRACRLASKHYSTDFESAQLWRSKKELEHMKIAVVVKFIANTDLREQLIATGTKPLVCCDAESDVSNSSKRLGEVLEGIRSIARGIHIVEPDDDSELENLSAVTPGISVSEHKEPLETNSKTAPVYEDNTLKSVVIEKADQDSARGKQFLLGENSQDSKEHESETDANSISGSEHEDGDSSSDGEDSENNDSDDESNEENETSRE